MCGRYVQTKKAREHARILAGMRADAAAARAESWNVCPTTTSLVVRSNGAGLSMDWLTWGLQNEIPMSGFRPINARIESVAAKPTFRNAWQSRRCVIPVDGWYEWKVLGKAKQPFYFSRRDGMPIFFGGLWEGETFCLITTNADGDLAQVHDRRPLALRDEDAKAWIDSGPSSPERLVFSAVPPIEIEFHPVSLRVSSPKNDGPELVKTITLKAESPETQMGLF